MQGFELPRYLGRWHEIARLDHRFERGLVAVTADYQLRDDGRVSVQNRGWQSRRQRWIELEGHAEFVGARDVGQLKVSFFWPFHSGYTIVALDPDYRTALVAGDDRRYLWVLARDPVLPEDRLQAIIAQAAAMGFDTNQLIRVPPAPP